MAGVITERGGALSHVSLLAREHNLPIIRVADATKIFNEGDHIVIDTEAGMVSFRPPKTK
jgi:phosphoenolpyruvate-protein kinase (PTS system EI component)